MEFAVVVLATFTILMFIIGVLPFRLPAKLMPVATSLVAWGCIELYAKLPALVESAGVAGGVAIVTRLAVAQLPEPASLDDLIGRLVELAPARLLAPRRPKRSRVRTRDLPRSHVPSL